MLPPDIKRFACHRNSQYCFNNNRHAHVVTLVTFDVVLGLIKCFRISYFDVNKTIFKYKLMLAQTAEACCPIAHLF